MDVESVQATALKLVFNLLNMFGFEAFSSSKTPVSLNTYVWCHNLDGDFLALLSELDVKSSSEVGDFLNQLWEAYNHLLLSRT